LIFLHSRYCSTMALLRNGLLLLLAVAAAASKVSPVEKVISLITGLRDEVADEGKSEASSYEKFACFCKDKTHKHSQSVKDNEDDINARSADITEMTANKKDDQTDLGKRKQDQETMSSDLDRHNTQCTQDKAAYNAELADLTKAVSSLGSAIKAMKQTGGGAGLTHDEALLQVQSSISAGSAVKRTSVAAQKYLTALSSASEPGYDYHSNDIVDLCKSLETDFKAQRKDLNDEWAKTDEACKSTRKSLKEEMASNKRSMNKLDARIERLAKNIAGARDALIQADADLKEDQLYLKDLTASCEQRANDYDQRSSMRNAELQSLETALNILSGDVKGRDEQVNERAALVQIKQAEATPVKAERAPAKAVLSFLQQRSLSTNELTLEAKKNAALSMLREEGRRIGSLAVSALAQRVAADPFKKVKGLIQKLIERLLTESQAEATKKGFCDTALASAELDRNNRFAQANDLSREVAGLEAKDDELSNEIEVLTKEIKTETADLKEATTDRATEKKDNLKTIATAKEGLDAVTDALQTLKSFYSQAAKAAFLQASPVDADTSGPGFAGNYQGKQGGMKAVFSLLEVIQSDFDRTIRTTEKEEAAAHRAFVELSQASESSISGKTTKKELDEQDLKTTKTDNKRKMNDMEDTVDLLDKALQELEELKPTCIDTGMSYKERVAKREEEIKALKSALTILA